MRSFAAGSMAGPDVPYPAMDTVRWGMIGAGDVTEIKSGPGFRKAQHSQLVAVMRRSPGLAADYARRHGVARYYECAQELINDPDVDAIYIATPPGSHAELAMMVCNAGKPVYLEKPMARHEPECRIINEAFAARQLPLFVAYYRRQLPRCLAAKAVLAAGRLGEIHWVEYYYSTAPWSGDRANLPWRLRAEHSAGGVFLDVGCHALDLFDFLFGPLLDVKGSASNLADLYDVEDHVTVRFRTMGGQSGSATWNFAARGGEDRLEIIGSRGRLRMSVFGNEPIALALDGQATELIHEPNPDHVQQPLIQSIVNQLRGEGCCPSTGESAARTTRVIDRVLEDYYGGRADRFWQRPESWPGRPRLR